MVVNKTKWVTLILAMCFAILQVLQPFIHAHLDSNHAQHHLGFHVGEEHEENTNVAHDLTDHTLSSIPHAAHSILVATGIKQDIDPALLIDAITLVVVYLFFSIVIQSASTLYPPLSLIFHQSLKRRLPASRAPPL